MENKGIPIDDMAAVESLGFKCGLEIHQQLNTKTKLFCHCPVGLTHRRHDAEILRHMRPTLSELGEYDGTALMEFKTRKNVIYRLYRDRTCTYEMDDTPPFLVNRTAVDFAIQLALLFNCKIIDELHVIRKQYLDGSIPTGFQRTMIIGIDGWVPYKGRKIEITQINLEEEACREISDIGHDIVFSTDRLSIPLVEIITGADMKNPGEATEVCRLLGNAMKITGLVRRGIGTVRQDVNVSVSGGDRVEIKGVYKAGNIRKLTAVEAFRQRGLLELKREFNERFPSAQDIPYREKNLTDLLRGSSGAIGRRLESDQPLKVSGLLLPRLADIIGFELQPGRDFGFELSGRVRVIACIDSRPNIFFYSRRDRYDIPESTWRRVAEQLKPEAGDDIAVVCGPSADVATALDEIKIRISELSLGVINETRQDLKDGTTDFERILPGPDRMYPDTDHPPVKIEDDQVHKLQQHLSEPLWDKQARWRKLGLSEELVSDLSLSLFADLFDRLAEADDINVKKAAHICTAVFVDLRRNGHDLSRVDPDRLYRLIRVFLRTKRPLNILKEQLQQLAGGYSPSEAEMADIDENEFDLIWESARQTFAENGQKNDDKKFRRYVTGRLLERFPRTDLIIPRVDRRLAEEKTA